MVQIKEIYLVIRDSMVKKNGESSFLRIRRATIMRQVFFEPESFRLSPGHGVLVVKLRQNKNFQF